MSKYWMDVRTYDMSVIPARVIYHAEYGFDSVEDAEEYVGEPLVYLPVSDAWWKERYGEYIKTRKTVYIMTKIA